jgi:hypothetical protein
VDSERIATHLRLVTCDLWQRIPAFAYAMLRDTGANPNLIVRVDLTETAARLGYEVIPRSGYPAHDLINRLTDELLLARAMHSLAGMLATGHALGHTIARAVGYTYDNLECYCDAIALCLLIPSAALDLVLGREGLALDDQTISEVASAFDVPYHVARRRLEVEIYASGGCLPRGIVSQIDNPKAWRLQLTGLAVM